MEAVNTERYFDMIGLHYDLKIPFFVYGAPGIGKSDIPVQYFSNLCKEVKKPDGTIIPSKKAGRRFSTWDTLEFSEKLDAIENPDKYFIFVDFRLTQCDPSDLKGIPKLMSEHNMLEYSPLSWVRYFENPEADGAIIFDELNLATPMVAASAYQIINNRVVADIKLSDNVLVFGAGNRSEDKAYVNPLPTPLRDRFNEFELIPDASLWLKWAARNNISHHIMTFIEWKKEWIYKADHSASNKSTTPRGLVRASKLIKTENNILSEKVNSMLSISVGGTFAAEFQAYIEHIKDLNVEQYLNNPKKLSKIKDDSGKMYALCGVIIDHMPDELNNDEEWDRIFDCVECMHKEYQIILLNNMRSKYSGDSAYTRSTLEKNTRLYNIVKSLVSFFI